MCKDAHYQKSSFHFILFILPFNKFTKHFYFNYQSQSTNPVYNTDFAFNVIPSEHKLLIDLFYENKIVNNENFLHTYKKFNLSKNATRILTFRHETILWAE